MTSRPPGDPPSRGRLARFVPIVSWLPRYQRGWLAGDAIAGFTIWGLLIPERRHPEAVPVPGALIARPDAPLFYANAELVRDGIEQAVASSPGPVYAIVLVLDANDDLDITSAEQLSKLADTLHASSVAFGLAHIHGPALQMAQRSGLLTKIGSDHIFETTPAAVAWARSHT